MLKFIKFQPGQVPMQQVPLQQVPIQQQHMQTNQVPAQHGYEHSQPLLNAANIVHEKAYVI